MNAVAVPTVALTSTSVPAPTQKREAKTDGETPKQTDSIMEKKQCPHCPKSFKNVQEQLLKNQGCEMCSKKPVSAVKIEEMRGHVWMCDECKEKTVEEHRRRQTDTGRPSIIMEKAIAQLRIIEKETAKRNERRAREPICKYLGHLRKFVGDYKTIMATKTKKGRKSAEKDFGNFMWRYNRWTQPSDKTLTFLEKQAPGFKAIWDSIQAEKAKAKAKHDAYQSKLKPITPILASGDIILDGDGVEWLVLSCCPLAGTCDIKKRRGLMHITIEQDGEQWTEVEEPNDDGDYKDNFEPREFEEMFR